MRNITTQTTQPVQARMPKDLLETIDGWRREQKNPPTRPEAIRRLVKRALEKSERAAA
jgi:metal-responsive CopG/Arc/MetJ family transcriptional regulator